MLRWRAVLMAEDAYKKRIQDTLIDSLQSRTDFLEAELIEISALHNEEIKLERERTKMNRELITYEASLKEEANYRAARYRRQARWLKGGIGVFVAWRVARVLIPP